MPVHDWTKVRPGVYHNFHQAWTIEIYKALNRGVLPPGYFAMAEQSTDGSIPDVICLERWPVRAKSPLQPGGILVAEKPPSARAHRLPAKGQYAARANRIVIRNPNGEVVAIIELVSPGNKSSRSAMQSFIDKITALIDAGIHLLIVDLFAPGPRDPEGLHHEICMQLGVEDEEEKLDKPLTTIAYSISDDVMAYLNPFAVGEELPAAPVFLECDRYVLAPLEATYQIAFSDLPEPVRELFE